MTQRGYLLALDSTTLAITWPISRLVMVISAWRARFISRVRSSMSSPAFSEALRIAETVKPELVITDTIMPTDTTLDSGRIRILTAAAVLARAGSPNRIAFDLERLSARFSYDFVPRAGIAFEWNNDTYDETENAYGDYDATRYGVYLRFRQ